MVFDLGVECVYYYSAHTVCTHSRTNYVAIMKSIRDPKIWGRYSVYFRPPTMSENIKQSFSSLNVIYWETVTYAFVCVRVFYLYERMVQLVLAI